MATITEFPRIKPTPKVDKMIDAIFQELPCVSRKEIRTKVSKTLGRKVKPYEINDAITHLRKNAEQYGWSIPHAKKGVTQGDIRFIHVLVEKGRDPYFDDEHKDALDKGIISTLSHSASSLDNERVALKMASAYCKDIFSKRMVNSLSRRLGSILEDVNDLVAMLKDVS